LEERLTSGRSAGKAATVRVGCLQPRKLPPRQPFPERNPWLAVNKQPTGRVNFASFSK
jgi:hypothetical protein